MPYINEHGLKRDGSRDPMQERRAHFDKYVRGWRQVPCSACSGRYDHNGSPPCQLCGGTGKMREKPDPTE